MRHIWMIAGLLALLLATSIGASIETQTTKEKNSPHNRIKEEQIHVYQHQVVIDLQDVSWAKFTDTNSMDPVIDAGANSLEIVPKTEEDVKVGDIVSYKTKDGLIIHRVIDINSDEKGTYYKLKGDNNLQEDSALVRFEQITGVVVGILY